MTYGARKKWFKLVEKLRIRLKSKQQRECAKRVLQIPVVTV